MAQKYHFVTFKHERTLCLGPLRVGCILLSKVGDFEGSSRPMPQERRGATRHSFHGTVEIVNLQSGRSIIGLGHGLGLFGVFVRATTPFREGTEVKVRISLDTEEIIAVARVAHSRPEDGMGIAFYAITRGSQEALEDWVTEVEKQEAVERRSA